MNLLILNTQAQAALIALNATGRQDQQLTSTRLANGDGALNPDLREDCAPGQTWEYYDDFLNSLPMQDRADFEEVPSL
jgi:hypothetical protein